jgi:hypothetical protein
MAVSRSEELFQKVKSEVLSDIQSQMVRAISTHLRSR